MIVQFYSGKNFEIFFCPRPAYERPDLFRLCPPVHYASPFIYHVPLHSPSLRKNMARASGSANNKSGGGGGGTNGNDPICHTSAQSGLFSNVFRSYSARCLYNFNK